MVVLIIKLENAANGILKLVVMPVSVVYPPEELIMNLVLV